MSLLPIIYTSVLIFGGVVTTVLLVSYILYKAKGGGPKPASAQAVKVAHYPQQRTINNADNVYTTNNYTHRNYRTSKNQADLMFYNKPVNAHPAQPIRKNSPVQRIQIINKPVEKKIVVVKKSVNHSAYDENNFLGYYSENKKGALIQI